jgi:hypothetical protein
MSKTILTPWEYGRDIEYRQSGNIYRYIIDTNVAVALIWQDTYGKYNFGSRRFESQDIAKKVLDAYLIIKCNYQLEDNPLTEEAANKILILL